MAAGAAAESRFTLPGSHATAREASADPGTLPEVDSATCEPAGGQTRRAVKSEPREHA